jgi:probable phosphoglycerate mutase
MPDEAVIVSHGGVARVLLTIMGGVTMAEAPFQDIRQGEILRLEMGSHAWI